MTIDKIFDLNNKYKVNTAPPFERDDMVDRLCDFINNKLSVEKDNQEWGKEYAFVFYVQGEGGIGKTFFCRSVADNFSRLKSSPSLVKNDSIKDLDGKCNFQSVYLNLASSTDQITLLDHLALALKKEFDNFEMFPCFDYAHAVYRLKIGERINISTENPQQSDFKHSIMDTALDVIGCIPAVSAAADIYNASKSTIELLQKGKDIRRYKEFQQSVNLMPSDELGKYLTSCFANDVNDYVKSLDKGKKENKYNKPKKILFVLDTFEFLINNDKNDRDTTLVDWLFGRYGIVRLISNAFWVIAGREDIEWKIYDQDTTSQHISYSSVTMTAPDNTTVCRYLASAGISAETDRNAIAKGTECYPLRIGLFLELYYKSWNKKISNNYFYGNSLSDKECQPDFADIEQILSEISDSGIMSNRFFDYFDKTERNVILALACLKEWNDEMLKEYVWHDSVNDFLIYESLKNYTFIKRNGSLYAIDTDKFSFLVYECPMQLKRNLIKRLERALSKRPPMQEYRMLLYSLVSIVLTSDDNTISYTDLIDYLIKVALDKELSGKGKFFIKCLCVINNHPTETDSYNILKLASTALCIGFADSLDNSWRSDFDSLVGTVELSKLNTHFRGIEQLVLNALARNNRFEDLKKFAEIIINEPKFLQEPDKFECKCYLYAYAARVFAEVKLISDCSDDSIIALTADIDDLFNSMNLMGDDCRKILIEVIEAYVNCIISQESKLDPIKSSLVKYNELYKQYTDMSIENLVFMLKGQFLSFKKKDASTERKLVLELPDGALENFIQNALDIMNKYVHEYGISMERIDLYNDVIEMLTLMTGIFNVPEGIEEINNTETNFVAMFHEIASTFCHTMSLKYYDMMRNSIRLNKRIFKKGNEILIPHIKNMQRSTTGGIMRNLCIMLMYKESGISIIQNQFNSFGIHEENGLNTDISSNDMVELCLGAASNNNQICLYLLDKLTLAYREAAADKKPNLANLIMLFMDKVLYDSFYLNCRCNDLINNIIAIIKIPDEIRRYFAKNDVNSIIYNSLLEFLRGWVFCLNADDDSKFSNRIFELLKLFLEDNSVTDADLLCENMLSLFINLHLPDSFTTEYEYLRLFFRYIVSDKEESSDSTKVCIQYKKLHDLIMSCSMPTFDFLEENPEITENLLKYKKSMNIDFDNITTDLEHKFAKLQYEHMLITPKKYYDAVVGGAKGDKLIDIVESLDNDDFVSTKMLCYYRYKTKEEFQQFIIDKEEVLFGSIEEESIGALKDIVKLLCNTDNDGFLEKYLVILKQKRESQDFYKVVCSYMKYIPDSIKNSPLFDGFDEWIEKQAETRFIVKYDELYNNLKGFYSNSKLQTMFIKTSADYFENIFQRGMDAFGLDGNRYQWLKKTFGDSVDTEIENMYPNFMRAKRLYDSRYKVFR